MEEAKRRRDAGDRVFFLDSRADDAWEKAELWIPGAIRVPPDRAEAHVNVVPRQGLIVPYCT